VKRIQPLYPQLLKVVTLRKFKLCRFLAVLGSICFWASWIRIERYGSGSYFHQAKIARKTLIPTVLRLLFDFLSLKNDVNVASKSNKQKNFVQK